MFQIDGELAEQIKTLAERENVDVETLLSRLVTQYAQTQHPDRPYPSKFKNAEERRAALQRSIGVFDD